jgi:uncharacterized protein YqjF (DUF2071 family)
MTQTWYDLLFAHWPVPMETLRSRIPSTLEIDTYNGQAWIGVVPFGMSRVYPRWTFPVPWLSYFLETNVRTYVHVGDKPGVYFFSLDAENPIAVEAARRFYLLPYFKARMSLHHKGDWIHYTSHRTHRNAPPADFRARYRPTGDIFRSQPGSLEEWLTERYCLYTVDPKGNTYRGEIHHLPWPLQPAEAEIEVNTMTEAHGIHLPDTKPLLHFARELETIEWMIKRTGT